MSTVYMCKLLMRMYTHMGVGLGARSHREATVLLRNYGMGHWFQGQFEGLGLKRVPETATPNINCCQQYFEHRFLHPDLRLVQVIILNSCYSSYFLHFLCSCR